jgi:hypothetical protein
MPSFLTPIHESNDCHTPAGSPAGGQFCATGGTDKSYGKEADALLARLDAHGGRLGIDFGTTGSRSKRMSKRHYGMRDRRAAEKLAKAGVITITSGGTTPHRPRPGSTRTAWASAWTLERIK